MTTPDLNTGTSQPAIKRSSLLQFIYDWMIMNAAGRKAWTVLFLVSFTESFIFPIIPDVMLIPMMLAERRRAFYLAAWCTLASVLGGMLGYVIGMFLYDTLGKWLISIYGYGERIGEFRAFYAEWGVWVILSKVVSPLPYKIVTILSGFAAFNFPMFVVLSLVTRGARFTFWALLLYSFGERIRGFIERRIERLLFVIFLIVITGFVLVTFLV